MMQQSHLTAWQVHAPWDKRSKIEQDLRLARGIAAIFSDDVLATHVAMRGGTVLHNWYLANEGTRMVREEAEQLLRERLRNPAFRKDMDTLLRPNFGRYDIHALSAAHQTSQPSFATNYLSHAKEAGRVTTVAI